MRIIDTHVHLGNIYGRFSTADIQIQTGANRHPNKPNPYEVLRFWNIYGGKLNYLFKPLIVSTTHETTSYANLPNLRDSMKANNIGQSVILTVQRTVPESEEDDNSKVILEICRGQKDIVPFASVHPRDPKKAERIQNHVDAGCKGFKIHPVIQEVAPNETDMLEMVEEMTQHDLPILFHVGWGALGRGAYGKVEYYKSIAEYFNQTRFVFAHLGFYTPNEFMKAFARHENVVSDLSWQPVGMVRRAINKFGEDRLMYGSDWPYSLQSTSLRVIEKAVKGFEHPDELLEKIFHRNAERLINLA